MPDRSSSDLVLMVRAITGMTQEEFASALGVSRSLISAVENSLREPNVTLLRGLRKRFGISIDAFFDTDS